MGRLGIIWPTSSKAACVLSGHIWILKLEIGDCMENMWVNTDIFAESAKKNPNMAQMPMGLDQADTDQHSSHTWHVNGPVGLFWIEA